MSSKVGSHMCIRSQQVPILLFIHKHCSVALPLSPSLYAVLGFRAVACNHWSPKNPWSLGLKF